MSKIFELRQWVTPLEAAEYLSISLEERVTGGGRLSARLGPYLTLSVNFVIHAHAKLGRRLSRAEAGESEPNRPGMEGGKIPNGTLLNNDTVPQFDQDVEHDRRRLGPSHGWGGDIRF